MGLWNGIANGIGRKKGGIDWSSYWATLTDKVLFIGEIIKITDNKLYNQVSGASDYLTVGGSEGSYTFECPDTADYENADTNNIWFSGGVPATVTEATLIGSDYSSTPVKYDSDSPYFIRAIIIFKQGAVLTADEINRLHSNMELWIWWSLSLNANGVLKGNRPIISNPVVSSAVIAGTVADKVVITFDQTLDETSVPDASAFALAGKTISNVAVSGSTVTLTVTAAYDYGNEVTVNYTAPESNPIQSFYGSLVASSFANQAVVNNLLEIFDGNTHAWYDYKVGVTADGSNLVSLWADRLGSGSDLAQAAAPKPLVTADGILFDGANDFMVTGAMTINQPITYYLVFRQITWTAFDILLGSRTADRVTIKQYTATPTIGLYAGTFPAAVTSAPPLNTFCILRAIANGANSLMRLNMGATSSGNAGANNADGISLGGVSTANSGHMEVKELIVRAGADDATTQGHIYDYLSTKYSI